MSAVENWKSTSRLCQQMWKIGYDSVHRKRHEEAIFCYSFAVPFSDSTFNSNINTTHVPRNIVWVSHQNRTQRSYLLLLLRLLLCRSTTADKIHCRLEWCHVIDENASRVSLSYLLMLYYAPHSFDFIIRTQTGNKTFYSIDLSFSLFYNRLRRSFAFSLVHSLGWAIFSYKINKNKTYYHAIEKLCVKTLYV